MHLSESCFGRTHFKKVSGRKGWYAQSSSPSPDNLSSIPDTKVKLRPVLDFKKGKIRCHHSFCWHGYYAVYRLETFSENTKQLA